MCVYLASSVSNKQVQVVIFLRLLHLIDSMYSVTCVASTWLTQLQNGIKEQQ